MNETPIVQYIEYPKIENFLCDISYGGSLYKLFMNGNFAFRGHASDKYKLIPTALRPESRNRFNQFALSGDDEEKKDLEYFQIIKENHILRDFYKMCDRHGLAIENIKRYNQGDALFVCGSRRMQINVIVSEDELESFGAGGGL